MTPAESTVTALAVEEEVAETFEAYGSSPLSLIEEALTAKNL
jgi:hypothetical protein